MSTNVGLTSAGPENDPNSTVNEVHNANDSTDISVGDDPRVEDDTATTEIDSDNERTDVAFGDDRHVDDTNESIDSDDSPGGDQLSVVLVPRNRPSRPMSPGPMKLQYLKASPKVFLIMTPFSSQSSGLGRLRREWTVGMPVKAFSSQSSHTDPGD
jgi:hypothetical protein